MNNMIADYENINIRRVNEYELILEVLKNLNHCIKPSVEEHVESLEKYAMKVLEKANVYMAFYRRQVIGFIAYYINQKGAYISLILVDNKFQNKGIGKRLIKLVENMCKLNSLEEIMLEVRDDNLNAQRFYFNNGFEIYGKATKNSKYLIRHI